MLWIVTIKDERNPAHDPRNKVMSQCSVTDICTDSTGAHHSVIVEMDSTIVPDDIRAMLHPRHITRIESATVMTWQDVLEDI